MPQFNNLTASVKAVIFDLGNVLVNVNFNKILFNPDLQNSLNGKNINLRLLQNDPKFNDYNCGNISPQQFHEHLQSTYQFELEFRKFAELWCGIFEPVAEMEALFKQIVSQYPVGLLSDTDPLHWNYCLNNFPVLKTISRPTLSYEIGYMKPAPFCYQQAAENTGCPVNNCLFIDDKIENVDGAKATGMQAVRCINPQQLRADLQALNIL